MEPSPVLSKALTFGFRRLGPPSSKFSWKDLCASNVFVCGMNRVGPMDSETSCKATNVVTAQRFWR